MDKMEDTCIKLFEDAQQYSWLVPSGKKKKSYLVWAETVFPAVERRPREGERSWGPFYPSEIKLTVQ